jgi:hypothetical protein
MSAFQVFCNVLYDITSILSFGILKNSKSYNQKNVFVEQALPFQQDFFYEPDNAQNDIWNDAKLVDELFSSTKKCLEKIVIDKKFQFYLTNQCEYSDKDQNIFYIHIDFEIWNNDVIPATKKEKIFIKNNISSAELPLELLLKALEILERKSFVSQETVGFYKELGQKYTSTTQDPIEI